MVIRTPTIQSVLVGRDVFKMSIEVVISKRNLNRAGSGGFENIKNDSKVTAY